MSLKLIYTADNSPTIWNEELDEHYHSTYGAIQESQHVFINAGLNFFDNNLPIDILEIGMGTALNVCLTAISAHENKRKINFESIEKYPLSIEIVNGYIEMIQDEHFKSTLEQIHLQSWNETFVLHEFMTLKKIHIDINEFKPKKFYDLIFFDAFNPNVQPELWTETIFKSMYDCLKWNGILVTYCAKGYVKRNLKSVGFEIESLPGPVGKREMTRAIKRKIL